MNKQEAMIEVLLHTLRYIAEREDRPRWGLGPHAAACGLKVIEDEELLAKYTQWKPNS